MLFITSVMIFLTLLNIIVYYLQQHLDEEEDDHGEKHDAPLLLSDGLCRRFSLAEIKSATQNFNEGLVIGKGGFGKVYRGVIDKGASTVAIKRLGLSSKQGAPEFCTEIEMLSKFRHSHIASLIGYCSDHPEMIIVYEYMPSGTLADNLHKVGRSNLRLSWVQRLKICLGAARGLDYLHTGTGIQTRVIHRDVKSSNILLGVNWEAKISDFGLSKIGPAEQTCTDVSTCVKGTFGYLDPEYLLTHKLTRKSDVYAYGVVMFEALCGRPAVDVRLDEEQWSLAKWAKHCIKDGSLHDIVDPHLRGSILSNCLESYAQIAGQCLHKSSRKRPTMAEVVTRLEYALAMQETADLSLMDAEIISVGGDYDNKEGADSSTKAEVSDAGGGNLSTEAEVIASGNVGHNGIGGSAVSRSQYYIQPAKKVTFVKQVGLCFSIRVPVFSAEEYSDFPLQQLKRFSLHEIQVATDNFSSKNILGRGGFCKVYKGCLIDGSLVAVKRLIEKHSQAGELQFKKEVDVIGLALDRNLLQLQGFCSTPTERLLVYPYMGNGSVTSLLRERPEGQSALDWRTRKRIALGSARGLTEMHNDYIVHGNVKAASIFLTEFSEVVIGNIGLAQLRYQNVAHLPALVRGPSVYLAPEYLSTGKCSLKTDVFGYGLMLLELISGQGVFDLPFGANDDNVMMLDWVKGLVMERKLRQLVDVDLQGNYSENEVERLTKVALLCTQTLSMERPRMSEVVRMLQGDGITERWEEWQEKILHPEFSKTTRSHTGWSLPLKTFLFRSFRATENR